MSTVWRFLMKFASLICSRVSLSILALAAGRSSTKEIRFFGRMTNADANY